MVSWQPLAMRASRQFAADFDVGVDAKDVLDVFGIVHITQHEAVYTLYIIIRE